MFLAVNYSIQANTVREDTLDGREYWVVPVALITEGVHRGSNGSLYYSRNQIQKSAPSWNNKPVTVCHPKKGSEFISAADKEVLSTQSVGFLLNSRFDNKLRADAWLDKEKVRRIEPRIEQAIKDGLLMEVSTGLFHDQEVGTGTWNGENYSAVALNFQPDHLAILPDEIGACSIADGAGLLQVNSSQTAKARLIVNEISQNQLYKNLSQVLTQRRGENAWVYEVYDKYFIYHIDGKLFKAFYTQTKDSLDIDLSTAEAVQEMKTFSPVTVTLNRSNPSMSKRNEQVTSLIANSAYTESDREWLTALEDAKFNVVVTSARPLVANNEPAPPAPPTTGAPTPPTPPKEVTLQSYVDDAPEHIKAQLQESLAVMNSTRNDLIANITGVAGTPFKPEELAAMPTATLRGIAALARAPQTPPAAPQTPPAAPAANANYSGQAPLAANANGPKPVTGLGLLSMFPVKK